jgi:prefoldin subunit 5
MSKEQKDRMCSEDDVQQTINQFEIRGINSNIINNNSLKRHATSERPRFSDEDDTDFISSNKETGWTSVINNRQKKKINDRDDRIPINLTRTFTNSMQQQIRQHQTTSSNNNNNINQNQSRINANSIKISNYALNYAADYYYPPFKLECEPKVNDKKQGVKMVNDLVNYIRNDFLRANPLFSKPILVDLWWIDFEGNLQMIIKTTELYVYLCKNERYPSELNNIKINPIPPAYLPPQHTIILKWIKNSITDQDIKEELNMNYKSIRSISSMNGTLNDKTRHVKIELFDKIDYETLLNVGKITLLGQLYYVDEFLPVPKILICGRCNQPGHIKKTCQNSTFDICRRCGGNRSIIDEHKECPIKCHHCGNEHLSTDYRCPLIEEYRYQTILELKKHPEKLPQHVQLFIPSQYRDKNDKTKIIQNKTVYHQQQHYNRNDQNQWPVIGSSSSLINTTINQNLNETIKSLNNELQELKKRYEEDQQRIESKYSEHINSMKQTWLIMQQQQQTQQQMLSIINNNMKQIVFFTCMKTTSSIYNVLNKIRIQMNCNEYDDEIQQLENQMTFIKDSESSFSTHINALEQLTNKQNETLNKALDNLFKNQDV